MNERETILIVDDDPGIRKQIAWALRDRYAVAEAENRDGALERVRGGPVDLVLLDLRFPPFGAEITGGKRILEGIQELKPGLPVIIMTADTDRATAVEMLARGAFDLFRKPVDLDELTAVIRRALRMRRLEKEVRLLRGRLHAASGLANLIGRSHAMLEVARLVRKVADTDATVLITGESGTGKELVARALHEHSGRRDSPFVALNCSAVPETLIDDELFGHERGAFTGAVQRRVGKFEYADGGTLFLDEIGDLPEPVQRKLLRVLQESELERLGANETIRVNVRLVAATHRDLAAASRDGAFRKDLYYRLKVVTVSVPPLRERIEDIPLLVDHFMKKHGTRRSPRGISPEALEVLQRQAWPGNVRELENLINGLSVTADGPILEIDDLPAALRGGSGRACASPGPIEPDATTLPAMEKAMIRQALRRAKGNRTRAAGLLGISRHVLLGKLRRHGIRD